MSINVSSKRPPTGTYNKRKVARDRVHVLKTIDDVVMERDPTPISFETFFTRSHNDFQQEASDDMLNHMFHQKDNGDSDDDASAAATSAMDRYPSRRLITQLFGRRTAEHKNNKNKKLSALASVDEDGRLQKWDVTDIKEEQELNTGDWLGRMMSQDATLLQEKKDGFALVSNNRRKFLQMPGSTGFTQKQKAKTSRAPAQEQKQQQKGPHISLAAMLEHDNRDGSTVRCKRSLLLCMNSTTATPKTEQSPTTTENSTTSTHHKKASTASATKHATTKPNPIEELAVMAMTSNHTLRDLSSSTAHSPTSPGCSPINVTKAAPLQSVTHQNPVGRLDGEEKRSSRYILSPKIALTSSHHTSTSGGAHHFHPPAKAISTTKPIIIQPANVSDHQWASEHDNNNNNNDGFQVTPVPSPPLVTTTNPVVPFVDLKVHAKQQSCPTTNVLPPMGFSSPLPTTKPLIPFQVISIPSSKMLGATSMSTTQDYEYDDMSDITDHDFIMDDLHYLLSYDLD